MPLGRATQVSEVAKPIVFLISDGATYITGQNIPVGGVDVWRKELT
ncbi:hypothetical protein G8J22_00677 [Lentilactobacillus hilgardii]|nr:SDR family oxidoreductase [Lentilactobacillus hilgardii]EEI20259.1 hypothetical protein HMPREF0497_0979 [Lentilactobacillus buchneri ATCC 11577]MCT3396872.1 SDR family oxidoreductase [Lentilactobacillus hilgardii]QIR08743.1 hypothetical protein G8J22_00677 [Lentilactobacillus hilgardii]